MTNPEIVPCRMCKGRKGVVPPEIFGGSVRWIGCTTVGCGCTGPERTTEAEAIAAWNELMQPSGQASPEPKAETVRVRIGYWRGTPHNLEAASLERQVEVFDPDFVITADIPLPQPTEIPGTVESRNE
jgi:hypothetical protein